MLPVTIPIYSQQNELPLYKLLGVIITFFFFYLTVPPLPLLINSVSTTKGTFKRQKRSKSKYRIISLLYKFPSLQNADANIICNAKETSN